jgi:hypothetical protein
MNFRGVNDPEEISHKQLNYPTETFSAGFIDPREISHVNF